MSHASLSWLLPLSTLFACAASTEPSESLAEQAVVEGNGISMNGISMNGISMNGTSMDGVSMTGVSLTGTSGSGTNVSMTSLTNGGSGSAALIGASFQATLTTGQTIAVRVDSITQDVSGLSFFDASYPTDGGRVPLCGVDGGGSDILAIAVPGWWNLAYGTSHGGQYTPGNGLFTPACRGKTIAKCVELGFSPSGATLNELQACVRMLRGDYCGDGTPFTVTGQTINLYDKNGVQADTQSWKVDAAWAPTGATCIGDVTATRFYQTNSGTPPCVSSSKVKSSSTCGQGFGGGALIVDETPPQP